MITKDGMIQKNQEGFFFRGNLPATLHVSKAVTVAYSSTSDGGSLDSGNRTVCPSPADSQPMPSVKSGE
ncbi:hypothetical protein MLD38_037668 [Melastoma candidum]|uniref:Uncharacterized protein n=1 Tax=Melastoma candidum TaxID=119954 RepID=A0ACB9LPD1_9MYRT|nr:hypothetical protein MLD38_037668 [Melastoma candidum]